MTTVGPPIVILAAIEAMRARIEAQAERIGDAELRRCFLEEVPEHARTRGYAG